MVLSILPTHSQQPVPSLETGITVRRRVRGDALVSTKGPADNQVPGDLGLRLRLMTLITEAPLKVTEVIPQRDAAGAGGAKPPGTAHWVLTGGCWGAG